jgi:hypothetical protein
MSSWVSIDRDLRTRSPGACAHLSAAGDCVRSRGLLAMLIHVAATGPLALTGDAGDERHRWPHGHKILGRVTSRRRSATGVRRPLSMLSSCTWW